MKTLYDDRFNKDKVPSLDGAGFFVGDVVQITKVAENEGEGYYDNCTKVNGHYKKPRPFREKELTFHSLKVATYIAMQKVKDHEGR